MIPKLNDRFFYLNIANLIFCNVFPLLPFTVCGIKLRVLFLKVLRKWKLWLKFVFFECKLLYNLSLCP